MNLKPESKDPSYLPVAWEYREIIEEQIKRGTTGRIIYFCKDEGLCEKEGAIAEMKDLPSQGVFLTLNSGAMIRIDRIITLFGKPGAAYNEYDAYGNACLDCTGGYDKEELKGYSI